MLRTPLLLLLFLLPAATVADELPARAERAAAHAAAHYADDQVAMLADLVRFRTVAVDGVPNADNPEFRAFAGYVRQQAQAFGLDFTDFGSVLIVGLGDAKQRLGVITHGDVQPADPAKWAKSPFALDTDSEPGRLIARGTEDDKAAIATALYAMKTIKDLGMPLTRRIELWISLTEESDWVPFQAVLAKYPPPEINIGIDSNYPVVVAEKGWGMLQADFAAEKTAKPQTPRVRSFAGGAFVSQVPEDARLEIVGADAALIARIRARAAADDSGVQYTITETNDTLTLIAKGRAAHSSTPENGLNALTHAAALLEGDWLLHSAAGRAVAFVNALLGTDYLGRQFGNAAYAHPFMGPLTISLSTAETTAQGTTLVINTRAPAGKTPAQLEADLRQAVAAWAGQRRITPPALTVQLTAAYLPEKPVQVAPLLTIFRHYTGIRNAQPISIGGGTNARLLPNGVNFGPAMPGAAYSGHSEHEFITREQMQLNLRMYAAMLAWLAGGNTAAPE